MRSKPSKVDLSQCALIDLGTHPHAVGFLVVRRVVLDRRADTLPLDSAYQSRAELAADQGVFGEVLEVAPAQRRTLDVDAGTEKNRDFRSAGLGTEGLANSFHQLPVPRRAEPDGRREAGGRHALTQPDVIGGSGLLT